MRLNLTSQVSLNRYSCTGNIIRHASRTMSSLPCQELLMGQPLLGLRDGLWLRAGFTMGWA